MNAIVPVKGGGLQGAASGVPEILVRAGANAVFAAEEFFKATINNAHTKRAYGRSVARFLAWCEEKGFELREITPGLIGEYVGQLAVSPPTKNQALAPVLASAIGVHTLAQRLRAGRDRLFVANIASRK